MTPAGLLATTHPATVGTRDEQLAEKMLARALLTLRDDRDSGVSRDDAVDGALTWLAPACNEAGFNTERFEALTFMVENVANAWQWREEHDCEQDGFDEDSGHRCTACERERLEKYWASQPVSEDDGGDCPF